MHHVNAVVTVRQACQRRFEIRWHFVDRSWNMYGARGVACNQVFCITLALQLHCIISDCCTWCPCCLLLYLLFSLHTLFVHLHCPVCLSLSKLEVYLQLPTREILPSNGLAAIREVVYILCAIFCSIYMFPFWEHAFFIYIWRAEFLSLRRMCCSGKLKLWSKLQCR